MAESEGPLTGRIPLRRYPNGRPLLMGVVNCTPDSFHADSRHGGVERALQMIEDGADWIDIGGESTRPGAEPTSIEEEIARVIPVIEGIRKESDIPISIDSRRAEVAAIALDAGADMINDVSGLRDLRMFTLVIERGCPVCIMHMQGEPGNMQSNPNYEQVFEEVYHGLLSTARRLVDAGHDSRLIVLDPGIGFGKTLDHNLELLSRLERGEEGFAILWGTSRKSMIGELCQRTSTDDRLAGTLATAAHAQKLGVDILRVHDVAEHRDLGLVLEALEAGP